jgi:hypothetical protein
MHAVRLSFDSDAELEASTAFLKQLHPLDYTAAVKKSQVKVTCTTAAPFAGNASEQHLHPPRSFPAGGGY